MPVDPEQKDRWLREFQLNGFEGDRQVACEGGNGMRGSRYTIIILLGLLAIFACGMPDARALDATRRAEIESEVGEFLAAYREAFNAGDTDAIHEMYIGDDRFAIFEDGVLRYATPAAVVEALKSFPPGMTLATEHSNARIIPLTEHLATASLNYQTRITTADGGSFEFGGVVTLLAERTANGWRIVTAHTSSVRDRTRS